MPDEPTTQKTTEEMRASQNAGDAYAPHEPSALRMIALGVLGVAFYPILGMGVAAIFSDWARGFWISYWPYMFAALVVAGSTFFVSLQLEKWLRKSSAETNRKVFSLIAILAITAAIMGLIGFGSTEYLTLAAQLIIIAVAGLLPAVTFFVFVATRRPSIFNEFIGNLGRLGLLARRSKYESSAERDAG